jgi:ABC-type sugar transport system substrate-binding protein
MQTKVVFVVQSLEGEGDATSFVGYHGAYATWTEAERAASHYKNWGDFCLEAGHLYAEKTITHGNTWESMRIVPMEVGMFYNMC